MKALVYHGPNDKSWGEVPDPTLVDETDAIVRVDSTTICGSDLHILKGDLSEATTGRFVGHEAVGTVEQAGSAVNNVKVGDRVLVSCISACGRCRFCREVAGHQIDAARFATHHFLRHEFMKAYEVLANASETGALKVVLTRE